MWVSIAWAQVTPRNIQIKNCIWSSSETSITTRSQFISIISLVLETTAQAWEIMFSYIHGWGIK